MCSCHAAGGNHCQLRRWLDERGISTDRFSRAWKMPPRGRIPLASILVEGSTYHRGHLKRRLDDEGLKERRCELCGQGEEWRGARTALILDHVNGVANDNRLENLRIVCPNCAATLETHCGRQNRVPEEERECVGCGAAFRVRGRDQRFCSRTCAMRHPRPHPPRPAARKAMRPPYEQLVEEIAATSWRAVGRKYGVSDAAVRKWARAYYERDRAERAPPAA